MRLTFVEPGKTLMGWSASVVGGAGSRRLNLSGVSDLDTHSGLGWKLVDPDTNDVLGSGRTSTGGNVALPESKMTDVSKEYDLYLWGQQDGNAVDGLTNGATEPVKMEIVDWKVKRPPVVFGIDVSGTTSGGLKAYRIGDYEQTVFDHTGALKSVVMSTPAGVKSAVLAAAQAAGGSNVDADDPTGWVASQWLGYPTDPPSDDATSAFDQHAGSLQLFAQALAANGDAELGGVQGELPGGIFAAGATKTLLVSGPGLYLIVDDSGKSLPMIVGTKVVNEGLLSGDRLVDFADAGVRGKPRLGVAVLKTEMMEVSKRVVNDAGMDGFDLGADVLFEVVLRVPDLSGFDSVSYDDYEFTVSDTADQGLELPAASEVTVFMDVPDTDTNVTASLSVDVSGQTLTVSGLKTLFAESDGVSGVQNKVLPGSLIRVRYTAVLRVNAVSSAPGGGGMKANVNTATVTRSRMSGVADGWTDAGTGLESIGTTANVYTFQVNAVKVGRDDGSTPLVGAEFEVSRDGVALGFVELGDGEYRLATQGDSSVLTSVASGQNGSLILQGVEARALQFKETSAPWGYLRVPAFNVDMTPVWTQNADVVELVSYRSSGTNMAYVSQDGRSLVVADPSVSLMNLPYTGGVGILLLVVVGGAITMLGIRPYYLAHCAEATANII
ncbi:isopeptide-forming domain-containing fimbrial protein [Bifidobacterium aquikefiri]|uniref:isopeptide-forming domain-containing fimbrial protein n=1 Tax=Bifidobacterium aquikefiri TaxID=1653207 RepID=UPI0039EC0416